MFPPFATMDSETQWMLYSSLRHCAAMLSASAVLVDHIAATSGALPLVDLDALNNASSFLHSGITAAGKLMPSLEAFAQTLLATGGPATGANVLDCRVLVGC